MQQTFLATMGLYNISKDVNQNNIQIKQNHPRVYITVVCSLKCNNPS